MVQLTDKHFAVEVPDDARDFKFEHYSVRNAIEKRDGAQLTWVSSRLTHNFWTFSNDSWQFLFTTKEATEAQVIELVCIPEQDVVHGWNREIFNDWFKAKGCDTNKNYAIIQKL